MSNPWFKLYGTEMLSDPKYQRLNAGERSCWITLLCLGAIDNGIVKHCEEQYLITHSGIDVMDIGKYQGVTLKFEMLGMITKHRDEKGMEYINIKNWGKRQEVYSESTERVRKWREKKKKDDVTLVTLQSNARIEENRIEENRIEELVENTPTQPKVITKNFFKGVQDLRNSQLENKQIESEEGKETQKFLQHLKSNYPDTPKNIIWDEIQKFERYWTEKNSTGKKERWQMNKTFEVSRRLTTWFGKLSSFKKEQKINSNNKYKAGKIIINTK